MTVYRIFYDYYVNGELTTSDFVDIIAKTEDEARTAFIDTHTPVSPNFKYEIMQAYEVEGIYL